MLRIIKAFALAALPVFFSANTLADERGDVRAQLEPKGYLYGIGSYMAAGAPWNFSAFERQPAQPAPKLGQQTDEVLADVVGLSSAEIGRLHDDGVIAGPES